MHADEQALMKMRSYYEYLYHKHTVLVTNSRLVARECPLNFVGDCSPAHMTHDQGSRLKVFAATGALCACVLLVLLSST